MNNTQQMAGYQQQIEAALQAYFTADRWPNRQSVGALHMLEAMRYSIENGGKRIRPMLTLAFCEACGGTAEQAMPFACAVEMVHTYSLIHDDLPAMDDDDLRRGKPANHIVFGEANAVLAGDALLTLAFEVLLENKAVSAAQCSKAGIELARAAGFSGMVAGQVMDLQNEGKEITLELLQQTDVYKTGALFSVACALGCIAANATQQQQMAAREYAHCLGLAFQIVDDILDITSDEKTLGKPIGSDAENKKSTYVSLLGIEKSLLSVKNLTEQAVKALDALPQAQELRLFAQQLAERTQ